MAELELGLPVTPPVSSPRPGRTSLPQNTTQRIRELPPRHPRKPPTRHPREGGDPVSSALNVETSRHPFAFTASHFSLRGQRKVTKRKATPTTRPFGFAALLGLTGNGRTRLCEPQTCCRPLSRQPCATRPRKRGPWVCASNTPCALTKKSACRVLSFR